MSGELDELAARAAAVLVAALGGDSWQEAIAWFGGVVGQDGRLAATRAELARANGGPARDAVVQAQVSAWTVRIRDVVEESQDAARTLANLVGGMRAQGLLVPQTAGVEQPRAGAGASSRRSRRAPRALAVATAAVVAAALCLTGWVTHWPSALFGSSASAFTPMHWTTIRALLPADALRQTSADYVDHLNDVSCPAAGSCLAAGTYESASGALPLVETLSDGAWTPLQPAPNPPVNAAVPVASWLNRVVCSAVTACIGLGGYNTNQNEFNNNDGALPIQGGLVESLSGTTWTPSRLPPATAAGRDQLTFLSGMDCSSPGNCIAVGSNYYSAETSGIDLPIDNITGIESRAIVAVLANGKWTPSFVRLPKNAASLGDDAALYWIACAGPGWCMAVGTYTDDKGNQQGLIETFTGGNWAPTEAPLPAGAPAKENTRLWGVSCAAPDACVVVGTYGSSGSQGLIETITSGRAVASTSPATQGRGGSQLFSVKCESMTSCIAVGDISEAHGNGSVAAIATLAGEKWTLSVAPLPGNAAADSSHYADLYSVSCPTASQCTAVGSYQTRNGAFEPLIETSAGESAKTRTLPAPAETTTPSFEPTPSASNIAPSSATFSDGTRIVVAGVTQGSIDLKVTAGRSGLDLRGGDALQISPLDAHDKDIWQDAGAAKYYSVNSANALNEAPSLQPGQSVCVVQSFTAAQGQDGNFAGVMVARTRPDGTSESTTLEMSSDAGECP